MMHLLCIEKLTKKTSAGEQSTLPHLEHITHKKEKNLIYS